ncbi:protein-tyrosine phosphatase-like protein [Pisolithus croceorrhizus]|nr:protein-tyrosine phosphatase-like protein [Pisolithus croceorrhizus]KAI6134240.1 protein-tyrosine phosphatase-like protein [Pisolithus croceorrhizus]
MGGKRQASQASQDSASLVVPPSLYLGPCSAASSKPFLSKNSITHVLSIGASPSARVDGVVYQRLSISDSASSSIAKVTDAACDLIDKALASKKGKGKILVHCSAGISRSPMVVAAYLMKRKGMTLKEALGKIIRVRPQVSPNAGFLQQLKDLDMELYGSVSLEVDELPKREKDRLALFAEDTEGTPARIGDTKAATAAMTLEDITIAAANLTTTATAPDAVAPILEASDANSMSDSSNAAAMAAGGEVPRWPHRCSSLTMLTTSSQAIAVEQELLTTNSSQYRAKLKQKSNNKKARQITLQHSIKHHRTGIGESTMSGITPISDSVTAYNLTPSEGVQARNIAMQEVDDNDATAIP